MPIIKSKAVAGKSSLKAKVKPEVLEQIEKYCQWAGIYDIGYFIEKAAEKFFLQDDEWRQYQHQVNHEIVT